MGFCSIFKGVGTNQFILLVVQFYLERLDLIIIAARQGYLYKYTFVRSSVYKSIPFYLNILRNNYFNHAAILYTAISI